jgi:hypothetical protein
LKSSAQLPIQRCNSGPRLQQTCFPVFKAHRTEQGNSIKSTPLCLEFMIAALCAVGTSYLSFTAMSVSNIRVAALGEPPKQSLCQHFPFTLFYYQRNTFWSLTGLALLNKLRKWETTY